MVTPPAAFFFFFFVLGGSVGAVSPAKGEHAKPVKKGAIKTMLGLNLSYSLLLCVLLAESLLLSE